MSPPWLQSCGGAGRRYGVGTGVGVVLLVGGGRRLNWVMSPRMPPVGAGATVNVDAPR